MRVPVASHTSCRLEDVPLLVVEPPSPRATVLVYHGLLASKEVQRKEMDALARRGFRAVGVDAVGHGERAWADLGARLDADGPATLLEIVTATVDEIPGLLDRLPGPFGITGISMGGYIAFSAVAVEERLGVAVPILGNPDWSAIEGGGTEAFVGRSPHLAVDAFESRAVLAMNAGRDVNVPPDPARRFMRVLQDRYGHDRFGYVEYPDSEHFMRPDDWDDLWRRAEDWLLRWL